jgi:hypothetical protein
MMALAAISGSTWFAATDKEKHLKLAEEVFGTGRPIYGKLQRFVEASPNHLIFNEQHLTVLMRMLITSSSPSEGHLRELTDEEVERILMALVGVATPVQDAGDSVREGERPAGWVPLLVRSGLYFDKSNLGSDQGRAHALFVNLFKRANSDGHRWCDLETWMKEDLASFHEQLGFGFALGAWTKALDDEADLPARKITVPRDGLLADQLEPATVERLIAEISADRGEFRRCFTRDGDDLDHLVWDRVPFEKKPFLRIDDGRMILLSPRFLHAWMGEGFYYRLLDSAGRRPLAGSPARTMSRRFTEFHGELMEDYVLTVTEDSHRDQVRAGLAVVSGEQGYAGPDGSESLSPDTVISYGPDVVAIEVTGGRPARRARVVSDPEEMLEVVARVIGKMSELDRAISDIVAGCAQIEGLELDLVERIWPVVVVPSTILQSEMLWSHIEEEAPTLSRDPLIQPPSLLNVEDYEQILSLVEAGHGLPALLGARIGSVYRTMPPSHFLAQPQFKPGRPQYLDRQMREAGDEAFAHLFPHDSRARNPESGR